MPPDAAFLETAEWRRTAGTVASGTEPEFADKARAAVDESLHLFAPEEDEAILRNSGFTDVSLFFAASTWRGWIAYA